MIEVEARADVDIPVEPLVDLLRWACRRLGVERATVGLMIVDEHEMTRINADQRARPEPTDVLSFPIDGPDASGAWPANGPPPELGDIVICPDAANDDLGTLALHGLLHLMGYDHETDGGEMLALQDTLAAEADAVPGSGAR